MSHHLNELELMEAARLNAQRELHLSAGIITDVNADASAGAELDARVEQHLAECESCRTEYAEIFGLYLRVGDAMDRAAEQDDEFWLRQQAAARTGMAAAESALTQRPAGAVLGWLAAATLATLLIAGTFAWNVTHGGMHANVSQGGAHDVQSGVQPKTDADHEMLMAIEQDMDSGVADALQPAVGLVSEVSQAQTRRESTLKTRSKQGSK